MDKPRSLLLVVAQALAALAFAALAWDAPPSAPHDAAQREQLAATLDATAQGLRAQAAMFDAGPTHELGHGLADAADYLDAQVAAADKAAQHLDVVSDQLRTDALRLAELLRLAPVNLDAIQDIHDALQSFMDGTDALGRLLLAPQLPAIRTGLQGLETSLSSGSQQVDQLANYTYPSLYWDGWRPRSLPQPFWPSGTTIARGLATAADGIKAADKELASLGEELPKIRDALTSSRKVLDRGRETLATLLLHRELIDSLMTSLPETAGRMAEDLPALCKQLATLLRETKRLQGVARGLRATQQRLVAASATWPATRATLVASADALDGQRTTLLATLTPSSHRSLGFILPVDPWRLAFGLLALVLVLQAFRELRRPSAVA